MIIYHPVRDINHCLYRMLLVLEKSNHKKLDWTLFKLMDFYILFPHLLKNIKPFPREIRSYKKDIINIPHSYEQTPNVRRILFELEAIQNVAVQNLMAKDLISVSEFKNQYVTRTDKSLSDVMHTKFNEDANIDKSWFNLIINGLPKSKLHGRNGLKFRSQLMEYKYDT